MMVLHGQTRFVKQGKGSLPTSACFMYVEVRDSKELVGQLLPMAQFHVQE